MATALAQAGLNLFIAACLGASIGLERQWRQHLAGLRTNTLVALGAAIFITYGRAVSDADGATRIAAQVVTGIGFLGAGVIFKEGLNVRGLNTAATLWCSAAVGLLAGEGMGLHGLVAAVLVIATNVSLRPLVRSINRQPMEMSEEEQHYRHLDRVPAGARVRYPRSARAGIGAVPELNFSQAGQRFRWRDGPGRRDRDRDLAQAAGAGARGDRRALRRHRWRHSRVLAAQPAGLLRTNAR